MWSVLTSFLILVNLNHGFFDNFTEFDAAEEAKKAESIGTSSLVPASHWNPTALLCPIASTGSHFGQTSFKRFTFYQQDHDGNGILRMELSLRTALRQKTCALSGLQRALDRRHSPFKQAQVAKGLCQSGGLVMGMVSRPPEEGARCQTRSESVDEERECKSKGRQRQREGEKDGCGVTVFPERFHTLAIAGNHSCISDAIPTADPYCAGFNGTELRCQRHRAYVGCKGAVPRHHQGTSQDPTSCGQGRKEDYAKAIDVRSSQDIECSRERHQGVASPQGCKGQAQRALAQAFARISAMLGTATQALFGAAAQLQWPHQKGQARPGHGKATLEDLNKKAAGHDETDPETAELEDTKYADTEAAALAAQVQQVLQACAKAATKEETMEISDTEETTAPANKRQRSLEPFGGPPAGAPGM